MKIAGGRMVLGICLLGLAASAAQAKDDDDKEIQYKVISSGQFSGITHQMSMVVQDEHTFHMMWEHHSRGAMPMEEMPKVDFNTETVIAEFLGGTPSCGYDVQISELESKMKYVEAKSLITTPKDIIVCLVATQPYEIIKTPKITNVVAFKQKVNTR